MTELKERLYKCKDCKHYVRSGISAARSGLCAKSGSFSCYLVGCGSYACDSFVLKEK